MGLCSSERKKLSVESLLSSDKQNSNTNKRAIIIVLIVGFTIFTVVDMINSARRRRDIERKVAAEHNRQAQELGYAGMCDCSRNKGNKSKKDGKKDKKKFKDNGDASLRPDAMGTLTAEQWFALVYPQLSVDEATSKSLDNLKESHVHRRRRQRHERGSRTDEVQHAALRFPASRPRYYLQAHDADSRAHERQIDCANPR